MMLPCTLSRPIPSRTDWIDAAPFRAWLRYLMNTTGESVRVLACLAGISPTLAARLVARRASDRPLRRIRHEDAARIIALTPADVAALGSMPAAPSTGALVQELVGRLGAAATAKVLGDSEQHVQAVATGGGWLSQLDRARALAAWDELNCVDWAKAADWAQAA